MLYCFFPCRSIATNSAHVVLPSCSWDGGASSKILCRMSELIMLKTSNPFESASGTPNIIGVHLTSVVFKSSSLYIIYILVFFGCPHSKVYCLLLFSVNASFWKVDAGYFTRVSLVTWIHSFIRCGFNFTPKIIEIFLAWLSSLLWSISPTYLYLIVQGV